MRQSYQTFRDYHDGDLGARAERQALPGLTVSRLTEPSGDVRFVRTATNGAVLTLDGAARHLTQMDGIDDPAPSRPGEISLIPAGVEVRLAWTNHAPLQHSLMVEFDTLLFDLYAPELSGGRMAQGHLVPANFAARPTLAALIRMAAQEIDPETRRGALFAQTVARLIALELAATAWTRTDAPRRFGARRDARLGRAIDYVETFYDRDIGLVDIAAAAGLSPSQLTVLFRRETGRSPYAYVVDRRIRQAVALLRGTALPLAVIAVDCGFADQSHMSRHFRARLGCTPLAVRQDR